MYFIFFKKMNFYYLCFLKAILCFVPNSDIVENNKLLYEIIIFSTILLILISK